MRGFAKTTLKILFFANTDWYLFNFRLPLAGYLRGLGHELVMLSPPGPYVARMQSMGVRALTVPMQRRSLNPLRELDLIDKIRRIYAKEQPDLVHHFTIKCVVYGGFAAGLARVPACVSAVTGLGHVFSSQKVKDRLLRIPVRALLRLALNRQRSRLILQNPDDVTEFQNAGLIAMEKIRLIRGSGVNTARFHPLDPTQNERGSSPVKVLLATRLLWEKGVREYVSAARRLRDEGLAVEFLLAGEPDPGNPTSIPPEQLAAWSQEGHVVLLGYVEDIAALWQQVDVAVLPSDREGTPRSLLEAAACGLPLVATDVPGCREIVEHEVNGLFVAGRLGGGCRRPVGTRDKEYPALADAIRRLCLEPETRRRMGQASRTKVLAEFDERIVFEKTLAVYRELGVL